MKVYGDKDLQVFVKHYQTLLEDSGVNVADAEIEWTLLKKEVYDEYLNQDKPVPEWKDLNKRSKNSHILAVIDLILTMAPSSAEAERGFSQLKLIKTDLRSKLGQDSLNHCLGIKLLSEGITAFDPLPAISHWNGSGIRSRRPMFKDNNSKKLKTHTFIVKQTEVINIDSDAGTQTVDVSAAVESQQATTGTQTTVEFPVSESHLTCADSDSDYDSEVDSDLDEPTVFHKLLKCDNYYEHTDNFTRVG